MSLYPNEEEITMFGEKMKYPGLKDGKFTNGSFSDPKQLASFIPAETLNLILDNLGEAIKSVGLEPNNTDIDQLAKVISKVENNPVLSERIENAIILSNNEIDYVTPDENGIVYSQTVDLQQVLADKLGQNKKIVSNYFYSHISIDLLNIMFSAPSVISRLSVYNSAIFNSSSILFYGNKIKIKSLENTTPIYET